MRYQPRECGQDAASELDAKRGTALDLIVNFAPTGMIPTKRMTPHVPVSVAEIVEQVHEAWELGITIVHVHARDPDTGEPTYRAEVYRDIIEGIRGFSTDLIVCVSLSGRKYTEFEKRTEPLQLDGDAKPDMGSLTLSSLNFARQESMSSPTMVQDLAGEMQQRGIAPELEAFDVGMVNYAGYLESKGLIKPPHYFNLLFGNIASAQADMLHASVLLRDLPPRSYWSMAGLGDAQLVMNTLAIAVGGGARVGLEDNIWYDRDRTKLAHNTDLIRRVHRLAEFHGRSVMESTRLRELLGLQPGNSAYGRADAQRSNG